MVETFPTARPSTADFDNTIDIREATYQEWYKNRTKKANEAKAEKARIEKEKKEKEEKVRVWVR